MSIKNVRGKYKDVSDFLLNAPKEEQRQVFMEAARRANKDQRDLLKRSKKLQAV